MSASIIRSQGRTLTCLTLLAALAGVLMTLAGCGGGGASADVPAYDQMSPVSQDLRDRSGYALRPSSAPGGRELEIEAACCGPAAAEQAAGLAWALQAAHDWPNDVPVRVVGRDAATVTLAAERLLRGGLTQVSTALIAGG